MEVYNLKDKLEYLDEVSNLEYEKWADNKEEDKEARIKRKKLKYIMILIIYLFVN